MSASNTVDTEESLESFLALKRAAGLEDFKCHVEVTENTDLELVKKALVSVFRATETGNFYEFSVNDLAGFDDLMDKAGII